MSTLIVTTSWPRSRDPIAGTFVFDDARSRVRAGASIVVAAPSGAGEARIDREIEAIDVPHAGVFGTPGAAIRLRRAPWRAVGLWRWRRALAAITAAREPERCVAHWLVPSALAVATIASTAPLEAIAHGGDVRLLEALPRSIARACLETIASRAEVLRAVSPELADRLATIAPSIAPSIVVAPMPLALEDAATRARVFARADAIRGSFSRSFSIVVARLIPIKPIATAIARAARESPIVVVVGDGPDRARLEREVRARDDRVVFIGAVDHEEALAWIAASAHVVVARARGEGASTVAREAAALGVPTTIVDARGSPYFQRGFAALADGVGIGAERSFGRFWTK
jgi:glycosyltransferase involved in cell wall biosynthesis